jgi:hypothetical protein
LTAWGKAKARRSTLERTQKRLLKRVATSTIYAASNDKALALASWPLGYDPHQGPQRLAGSELIDISAVTDFVSLNHDTYANSPAPSEGGPAPA